MVWYKPGNTTKLRLYRLFKTTYAISSRLHTQLSPICYIMANSHLRKSLWKFWNWMPSTENWNWEIPTPSATTNCKNCTVDCVENEIHFLIECQKYPLLRDILYREVITMDNFPTNTVPEIYTWWAQTHPKITHNVLLFISQTEQIHNKSLDPC